MAIELVLISALALAVPAAIVVGLLVRARADRRDQHFDNLLMAVLGRLDQIEEEAKLAQPPSRLSARSDYEHYADSMRSLEQSIQKRITGALEEHLQESRTEIKRLLLLEPLLSEWESNQWTMDLAIKQLAEVRAIQRAAIAERAAEDDEAIRRRLEAMLLDVVELSDGDHSVQGPSAALKETDTVRDSATLRLAARSSTESLDVIMKQLSHSVGTPLSIIKAEAERIGIKAEDVDDVSTRIITAADLVSAFLQSFRRLVAVDARMIALDSISMGDALRRMADLYGQALGGIVEVEVSEQFQLPGFSPGFVVTVISPLLENALEHSEGLPVRVDCEGHTITVKNTHGSSSLDVQAAVIEGFTTKDGHDGLGLSIVKTLVASRDGSSLELANSGGTVAARVRFALG